jgi:exopolysaccharide biosynthesis polyprenyl glycosylphosphotransferase
MRRLLAGPSRRPMIVQRTRGLLRLLALAQVGVATVLFWGLFAVFALAVAPGTAGFANRYILYWLIVVVGLFVEMLTRPTDEVSPVYASSLVRQLPLAARQMAFAFGALLVFLALTKDLTISRTFLASFAIALHGALLWSNAALPVRFARLLFGRQHDLATLLVGPANRVGMLDYWLKRKRLFGLRIVGVLTAAPAGVEDCPVPVLGRISEFAEICEREAITQVIVLEIGEPERMRWLLDLCHQRGIRLLIVNDLAEQIRHPINCVVDEGVNLISLREEPLENPFNRVLKRAMDVTLALVVIAFILPWLSILVWLLQRWQSAGPLYHRQQRAGLQNRPFEILKFRTMHPTPGNETQQAQPGDARIFPAGRWLRRFSLDEMPQFWNVLRGEMSVVGPRPHLVEHNRQFAEVIAAYHLRTLIKPGITGLAQVRGFRGEARAADDIGARLQSDLIYLEDWSLMLDLGIIARTIWQMIHPPSTAV